MYYGNKHNNPYYQAAIKRNIMNNAHIGKVKRAQGALASAKEMYPEAVAYIESGAADWSDIATKFKMYGTLTEGQAKAVVGWKAKAEAKKAERAAEPKVEVGAVGMSTIAKLLETAKASGKFKRAPKFLIGVYTGEGENKKLTRKLKVYLAGATSKWKGWLQVKAPTTWVGRVNPPTGEIHGPALKGDPQALDALKAFEADPFTAIKEFGALSSECCFCAKALTDDRSRSKGIRTCMCGTLGPAVGLDDQ